MCWISLWHSSSYSTSFTVLYFVSHLEICLVITALLLGSIKLNIYKIADAFYHSMWLNSPLFQLVSALLPRHFLCYCLAPLVQLQRRICINIRKLFLGNSTSNTYFGATLLLDFCSLLGNLQKKKLGAWLSWFRYTWIVFLTYLDSFFLQIYKDCFFGYTCMVLHSVSNFSSHTFLVRVSKPLVSHRSSPPSALWIKDK